MYNQEKFSLMVHFIFVTGQSGSGKDTFCKKLYSHISSKNPDCLLIVNGDLIRAHANKPGYLSQCITENNATGNLAPGFVMGMLVGNEFLEKMTKNSIVIWNGSPRPEKDRWGLPEMITFLKAEAEIFVLEATDATCLRRMKKRNKTQNRPESNTAASLANKLAFYHRETEPLIPFFQSHPLFTVHRINAEQSEKKVFSDGLKALSK